MKKIIIIAASIMLSINAFCQTVTVDTTKSYPVSYNNSILNITGKSIYKALTYKAPIVSKYKYTLPIDIRDKINFTIQGDSIDGGNHPCIRLTNCSNVHIIKNKLGNSTLVGIELINCSNILIDSNFVTRVSTGVYALDSKSIRVLSNQMLNMQGPFPKGAFVQFDNVSGALCRVCYNKFENILGQSYPEDAISMFKSNGLSNDPIAIVGNQIRGGGPSKTGGGIMLGDNGGSYQTAKDNTLVDPGQYGMAVSGGNNISIINNTIYGKSQSFTNVGLYYWNQSGLTSSNITISGNKVNFTSQKYGVNNTFIGQSDSTPNGWSTNILGANIGPYILPAKLITIK